jgi:HK97 gp10 family phage protein
MSDVTVVGLQELGAKLDKLFKETAKKAIRKATAKGSEVYRKEMRRLAPVREDEGLKGKKKRAPGYLKKHIGRWIKPNSDGSLSAFVGPTKSAFYGRFYELGTSHQKAAATPFIRPAFDNKTDEAEKVFAEVVKQEIEKELGNA